MTDCPATPPRRNLRRSTENCPFDNRANSRGDDGRFFKRVKEGRVTIRRAERVCQWFSDHWPADLEWPAGIPRPPVTPPEPEETPAGDEAAPAGVDKQVEEPVA